MTLLTGSQYEIKECDIWGCVWSTSPYSLLPPASLINTFNNSDSGGSVVRVVGWVHAPNLDCRHVSFRVEVNGQVEEIESSLESSAAGVKHYNGSIATVQDV